MNPLNNNPFINSNNQFNFKQPNQVNNQLMNNVRNIKMLMQMSRGDPSALIQQFPEMRSVLQMAQGKDLKSLYMSKCQEMGIDPNVILNELRS